ncbi:carbon storage regulator [Legionella fairfieldensis]|uniref:carbon storage regulator n=1 Tax=Legionella fairfieldensis TaxID=45064 RepID=UPI00048BD330|nr:carbon storage regulator [Legionella fairfieldensis]
MSLVILSKRIGEFFTLSNDIHLFILGIHGNKVRIGIDAKPETIVVLDERIDEKKTLADFPHLHTKNKR